MDHRGRLRRDGRLRGRGPLPPLPGAGKATIVLVDHDRVEPHNLLRQNFYPEDVGRFKSQALADRLATGLPASRRLLGLRLPGGGLPAPTDGRYPGLPALR